MQWKAQSTFNGRCSYDPDIEETDKTGMTFTWYCRRDCETWPPFNSEYNIIDPKQFNTTCKYQAQFKDDRGCYMYDKIDGPGKILLFRSSILFQN